MLKRVDSLQGLPRHQLAVTQRLLEVSVEIGSSQLIQRGIAMTLNKMLDPTHVPTRRVGFNMLTQKQFAIVVPERAGQT
ncbi:MAG: hypothetical protein H6926_00545 [Chromatiales bacterium]|nr:hypothetical protein [Gammaproteobacteria bacterium]MCP5351668.1 hypothetical protein [Chromatiales bacterium]